MQLPVLTFLMFYTFNHHCPPTLLHGSQRREPNPGRGCAGSTGSAHWRSERLAVLHTEPLAACNRRGLGLGGGRAEVHRFSDQTGKLGQERRSLSPNIPGSFWTPKLSHLTDNHLRDQTRWRSKGVILGQEHVYLKAQQILCFPFDSRFLVPLGSGPGGRSGWIDSVGRAPVLQVCLCWRGGDGGIYLLCSLGSR